MLKKICAAAALAGFLALPACTSNQIAAPAVTQANVTLSQLQFQVGTANIAGHPGLNAVVTFRQPNGLSALLVNTPVITLPFTNSAPVALAGTDAGTNHIGGTPQGPNGVAEPAATFSQSVGAFAYGLLASNSITSGTNNSVFYPATNSQPYYAALIGVTPRAYYIGPGNAFVPNFNDGSLGTTFVGYPSGFTAFALAPVAGTYSLAAGVSAVNATVPTFTATTTLTSTALLPAFPPAVYASDGVGGGTVSVTVPLGVTETLVDVIDRQRGNYYTLVIRGTGPQTATLAPNLGPPVPGASGFGPSILPGNGVRLLAAGFDYPAIEAVPVGSAPPQAPVINNAGTACTFSGTSSTCPGQADITIAPSTVWVE